MLTKAIGLAPATLAASAAFGRNPAEQSQHRTFYLTHAETARELQKLATVIRSITDIRQLFTDIAQKSVAVRGTAGQIALAEWLVNELDQATSGRVHEYTLSGEVFDKPGHGAARNRRPEPSGWSRNWISRPMRSPANTGCPVPARMWCASSSSPMPKVRRTARKSPRAFARPRTSGELSLATGTKPSPCAEPPTRSRLPSA